MNRIRFFTLFILLALLLSACTTAAAPTTTPFRTPTPTATAQPTPIPTELSYLPNVADIVAKVEPSVVYISVEYLESSFFGQTLSTKTGSGVLLSADGNILTNNHVISDASKIQVLLPDSDQTYQAKLVAADSISDLAVIKIDGQNFPTAQFGDPSILRVGDWVIAIGNALGLEGGPTVTIGIVSNLDRSFSPSAGDQSAYYDIIQTSAAINPGNSGGPLVDLEGKVVGVNTLIISGAENIGFAISTNTARHVYEDLLQYGHVIRPYLGANFRDLTPDLASQIGLSVNTGVLVSYAAPNSPIDKAGIKANDVITSFQDQKVSEASRLIKLLWEYNVGDSVKITFWRGNNQQVVSVTLGERP
jgi:S1-C subfamily serine protease